MTVPDYQSLMAPVLQVLADGRALPISEIRERVADREDRLGLDVILIQAKRWTDNTVGRREIQSFAGSLEGARGRKGIFLTTSSFSAEARQYVKNIEKRIVLIDGEELAALMYEHGVGVSTTGTYAVKRLDSDFFSEE